MNYNLRTRASSAYDNTSLMLGKGMTSISEFGRSTVRKCGRGTKARLAHHSIYGHAMCRLRLSGVLISAIRQKLHILEFFKLSLLNAYTQRHTVVDSSHSASP
jgi:hypothetical protein